MHYLLLVAHRFSHCLPSKSSSINSLTDRINNVRIFEPLSETCNKDSEILSMDYRRDDTQPIGCQLSAAQRYNNCSKVQSIPVILRTFHKNYVKTKTLFRVSREEMKDGTIHSLLTVATTDVLSSKTITLSSIAFLQYVLKNGYIILS